MAEYEIEVRVILRHNGLQQQSVRHTDTADGFEDAVKYFGRYSRAADKARTDIAIEQQPRLTL